MSRIGKLPVLVPQGVKASVVGNEIKLEGPKGKLSYKLLPGISVVVKDGTIAVSAADGKSNPQVNANYGSARAHINNMVQGVSKGWKRSLELNGVGYTAKVAGKDLVLAVGFSHDVTIAIPDEIKATVTKNVIDLESSNKEILGLLASKIRKTQPPEPYLGKGIKYVEEKIRRKAGKTGKKA